MMESGESSSANPSSEDLDDSAWASMWLSGWESWTQPYLNYEARDPAAPKAPKPRRKKRASDPAKVNSCRTCGKILSSANSLRLHNKTHEGGRPFKCEECGARFARKDHLRVHYRVHTGERPYTCGFCGNSFAHSGTLKSHIRTHTGEKPFSCKECGVSFSDPSTLRMHRLKHTGAKSVCSDCCATFGSIGILNKHKKMHPGGSCKVKGPTDEEQLIPCDVCGRIFSSAENLSCHMKEHEEVSNQESAGTPKECSFESADS